MVADEYQIKGNMLYFVKKYFIDTYGQEAFDRLVDEIDDETVRHVLKSPILSQEWYPLKAHVYFNEKCAEKYGIDLVKKSAYYNAEQQFRGLYGLILKLVNLDMVISKINSRGGWSTQFRPGRSVVERDGDIMTVMVYDYKTTDMHLNGAMWWFESFIAIVTGAPVKGSYVRINESTTKFILNLQKW